MWSCLFQSSPSVHHLRGCAAALLSVTAAKNEVFQVGLRWEAGMHQAIFRLIGLTSFPCNGFLAIL